jgi:hypothetical protein
VLEVEELDEEELGEDDVEDVPDEELDEMLLLDEERLSVR